MTLKQKLAHTATALSLVRGVSKSFLDPHTMAEDQVFMAHAMLVGPVVVIQGDLAGGPEAFRYEFKSRRLEPTTYLLHRGAHFKRLCFTRDELALDNQLSSELNSLILAPHVTPST